MPSTAFLPLQPSPGQPVEALPTLVATLRSWSFRDKGSGPLWDGRTWVEPNADERERIMGYPTGSHPP
jgi:hypothetical protein